MTSFSVFKLKPVKCAEKKNRTEQEEESSIPVKNL
jgi:hypothetical protein